MKTLIVLLTALFATSTLACVGGGENAKCMANVESAPIAKQLTSGTKKLAHAKIIITKKEARKDEQTKLGSDVHDNVLSGSIT